MCQSRKPSGLVCHVLERPPHAGVLRWIDWKLGSQPDSAGGHLAWLLARNQAANLAFVLPTRSTFTHSAKDDLLRTLSGRS